jgi:hypothetical protein
MFRLPRLVARRAAFSTGAHRSVDPRVVFEVSNQPTCAAQKGQRSRRKIDFILIIINFFFFF